MKVLMDAARLADGILVELPPSEEEVARAA